MSAVELGTGYVALVPSARNIASSITKELGAPVEAVAAQSGARASAALTGRFSAGTRGIGKALGSGLLAGGVIIAALAGGALKLGSDFKSAYNTIRVETGATGKQFQGLQADFKAVLSQRPEGMEAVATAVSKLRVGLNETGKPLQEMAKQVLRLSSITKTDLSANIDTVTHLFNNWGISAAQQPAKLDELFRASQRTGISVSDLGDAMAKMGSPLRQLGFSFEDSAALLGLLNKSGIQASSIMPALSKSIATAAKSGKSAGEVFRDVFNQIRRAPTDTAAAGAAITVFGARAGPNLAGLIRQGKLSYDELSKSIASGGDTIAKAATDTAGFTGKFKIFLNQLRVAVEPIAIATVTFAINAMTAAGPYLQKFADIIGVATGQIAKFFAANPGAKFAVLASVIGVLLGGAVFGLASKLSFLFSPATLIIGAIVGLAAAGVYAYTHFAKFRDLVDRVGGAISSFAQGAIPKVQAAFASIAAYITVLIGRLREVDFAAIFDRARTVIVGVFNAIRGIDFAAIFSRVSDVVKPVIGGLQELGLAIVKIAIAALPVLQAGFKIAFAVLQRVLPPTIAAFYVFARVTGVVVGVALKVIAAATSVLAQHMTQLKPILLAVAAGFAAFKAGQGAVLVFSKITAGARAAASAAKSVVSAVAGAPSKLAGFFRSGSDTLRLRFMYAKDAVTGLASKIASGVSALASWAKQGLVAAASTVKQAAAFVAQKAAAVAAAVAQKAMAAATWLVNAAMDANPIGLVVIAIAALVAGVVLAYQHFTPFRNAIDAVGRAIASVFGWVKTHWPLLLAILTGPFGLAFLAISRNWDAIRHAGANVITWVKTHWPLLLAILTGPIGLAVLAISKNWTTIVNGVSTAFSTVVGFFTALPGRILGAIVGAGTLLTKVGGEILDGLWRGVIHGAKQVFDFFLNLEATILTDLGDAGSWLLDIGKQIVGGLVQGIKSAAGSAIDAIKDVGGGIIGGFAHKLHINSPSLVFRDFGSGVIEGLNLGIARGVPSVRSQMKAVHDVLLHGVAKTSSTPTTPVAVSLASRGQASTVTARAATAQSVPATSSVVKALQSIEEHLKRQRPGVNIEKLYARDDKDVARVIDEQQKRFYLLNTIG